MGVKMGGYRSNPCLLQFDFYGQRFLDKKIKKTH